MLHIILGILKIIGILLGIILLLLLSVFLAVLFVPVRYRGRLVRNGETTQAGLRVTWLLHLISVAASFDLADGHPVLEIRLFGVSLDRLKEFLKRRKNKTRKPPKKKQAAPRKKEPPAAAPLPAGPKPQEPPVQEEREEDRAKEEIPELTEESDQEDSGEKEEIPELAAQSDQEDSGGKEEIPKLAAQEEPEGASGSVETDQREAFAEQEKAPEEHSPESKGGDFSENRAGKKSFKDVLFSFPSKIRKLICKIRDLLQTLWGLFGKIKQLRLKLYRLISGIPESLEKLGQSIAGRIQKIQDFLDMLEEYEAGAVLEDVKEELIALLRHYRPREISGRLHFGTGDPAVTGQLTGLIYLLLPARAQLSVEPEFTEAVFEADLEFSGHIRAIHAARTAYHLFRNKRLMRLIKRLRKK